MSHLLLAKPILPPDFIDVSVGEPHLVRETLDKIFNLKTIENNMANSLSNINEVYEYPLPTGYQPLVDLLENKHGAPVIITNGAKQGLGACFYALSKMGRKFPGMRKPYWALIPPLLKMHGLEYTEVAYDSYLSLSPNNPDGFVADLESDSKTLKKIGIPYIHDAAYHTHVYLPPEYQLNTFGDAQIYSISKMFGLSGLRLGYVVCPNPDFYRYIQEYMESMTVGVSVLPQIFLEDLMKNMDKHPELTKKFEDISFAGLKKSKEIMLGVDSDILEVPANLPDNHGMFGWFKVGAACDFNKAKINAIDGALFGVPGYVRMNLAFNESQMIEVVRRLNSVKGK